MTAIDARRLARGVHLEVEPLPGGGYRVSGGRAAHVVNLADDAAPCDCADSQYRPGMRCAHQLAVLLRLGDPEVLAALQLIVPHPGRGGRRGRAASGRSA